MRDAILAVRFSDYDEPFSTRIEVIKTAMGITITASPRIHAFYYAAGIMFLALAKGKHLLRGYATPKTFPLDQTDRSIDYAVRIAEEYIGKLRSYGADIAGKRVLELGPGSDMGLGLYLVKKGARSYIAFDRYDLAANAPEKFYARMAARTGVDLDGLHDGRVAYVAREDFDVTAAGSDIDIVVSNAAFEHFDDVDKTVAQLSKIVKPGGIACIGIDLRTHSRWIRDVDPNNIYRYPEWLYRLFYFPGQPNRLRPHQYRTAFESNGWTDLVLSPDSRLDLLRHARPHRHFAAEPHWDWLSFTLCARKVESPSCDG